jgi:hypothetical protein
MFTLIMVEEEVELYEQEELNSMTKERFIGLVTNALNGMDLLDVIALLRKTAQRWGHSVTMKTNINIFWHHPILYDQFEIFFADVKTSVESKDPETFTSHHQSNQTAVFNVMSQMKPTHGHRGEVIQLLCQCD